MPPDNIPQWGMLKFTRIQQRGPLGHFLPSLGSERITRLFLVFHFWNKYSKQVFALLGLFYSAFELTEIVRNIHP